MKRIVTLLVGFAMVLGPASASAANSSTCAYNPQTCEEVPPPNTLPFTGLDVGLLALGGGGLLGAGLVARRMSRQPD